MTSAAFHSDDQRTHGREAAADDADACFDVAPDAGDDIRPWPQRQPLPLIGPVAWVARVTCDILGIYLM